MKNQQQNKFIESLCSDNFDPGKAISDLTGHEEVEIEKPKLSRKWQTRLDEQHECECDDLIFNEIV